MAKEENIEGLIKKLRYDADSQTYDKIFDNVLEAQKKSEHQKTAPTRPNTWGTFTKNLTKPAAAALIIFAVAVVITNWLVPGQKQQTITNNEEIQIPAELAAMPLEELLDIHFGKRQSAFSPDIVRAAAERAMRGLSATQIMALTKNTTRQKENDNTRTETLGTIAPPPAPPPAMYLWATAGHADLVVQGRVDRVEIDADDARAAILEKRGKWVKHRGFTKEHEVEEFVMRVKGTVQLDVQVSYPASAAEVGKPLVVDAVFCTTQRAGHIEEGKEYLVVLKQEGQIMSLLENRGKLYTRQDGVYPLDSNTETVSGLAGYGSMSLDHTWHYIMDAYDAVHERVLPPIEVKDYWLAKLQSEDVIECWSAVDYFTTLARYCWLDKLKNHKIVDGLTAVEYFNTLEQKPVEPEAIADAVVRQSKLLDSRYFDRYSATVHKRGQFVHKAFDLLIKLGDVNTNSKMVELYKQERLLDDSIFCERAYGNYDTTIKRINSLVPSASPQAEKSLQAVLMTIKSGLAAEDKEFIQLLADTLTRHSQIPRLIAEQKPDPAFIPVLIKAIENNYSGDLAWALYACGKEEEAAGFAIKQVRDYLNKPDTEELSPLQHYNMRRTIRLLGISGSETAVDLIEALTDNDAFTGLWGYRLQATAIMAFARMAGDRAIQPLRELYATGNYYIRTAAAVSLHYLGDDTGYDLLELFVKHQKHNEQETKKYWLRYIKNWDARWGRPFYEALLYLRSPRTEDLFVDRLRNGVRESDMEALEIARQRQSEVLPILLEHLNSRDRGTRVDAHKMLKKLTGKDFGYSPWRYPLAGKQIEAVEKWRSYIEQYLAQTVQ